MEGKDVIESEATESARSTYLIFNLLKLAVVIGQ